MIDISGLKRGDVVVNRLSGLSYVVLEVEGGRAFAARSIVIAHEDEWDRASMDRSHRGAVTGYPRLERRKIEEGAEAGVPLADGRSIPIVGTLGSKEPAPARGDEAGER